jgi:hypothetical protein
LLDLNDTADPIADHLAALRLLEGAAGDVDVLIPGHGSIGGADQLHARIDQDRAYLQALRDADGLSDPRLDPSATFGDWLPGVHERQLGHLAPRTDRDERPDKARSRHKTTLPSNSRPHPDLALRSLRDSAARTSIP